MIKKRIKKRHFFLMSVMLVLTCPLGATENPAPSTTSKKMPLLISAASPVAPDAEVDDAVRRQADYLLEAATLVDIINKTNFFKPYNRQLTGAIADRLKKAAAVDHSMPCSSER